MAQPMFEELPALVVKLTEKVEELRTIVNEKLTTPEGHRPDVTMTAEEVAAFMKCSVDNVHKKRRAGKLPSHQLDGKVFFIQREIEEATKVKPIKKQFFK